MASLVVVVGATGKQGGSIVSALLKDGSYKIRGITRNTSSSSAHYLIAQGVEMVEADLNSEKSLAAAFQGATAIFAVTAFFKPFLTQSSSDCIRIEYTQGVNLARAASRTPTLQHYIWSILPNSRQISDGKLIVAYYEGKNRVDDYIRADKVLFPKATFLWATFYAVNFQLPNFAPNLLKTTGRYAWLQPTPATTKIALVGAQDVNLGLFALAILQNRKLTLPGKIVLAETEKLSMSEILDIWCRVTRREADYVQISHEAYRRLWPKWGEEMDLSRNLIRKPRKVKSWCQRRNWGWLRY